jgi:hypothetical protein
MSSKEGLRDCIIPVAIPLFAALLWDGFSFWDFFPLKYLGEIPMSDLLQDVLAQIDSATPKGSRKFRVVLIGSSDDILEAIHALHARGYAEVGVWSPLVPMPNSTHMVSILTRYRAK